jgi:AcrR family transcriptional regulator
MRRKITLDLIIQTAAQIADEKSLDSVSLTAIADALEIKKQSMYNHVDNLEEVKRELVIYASNNLKEELIDCAIGRSREVAIKAIAETYRRFVFEHHGQYHAIVARVWRYEEDEKVRQAAYGPMNIIRKVLDQYKLEETEIINYARGLRTIMHGFASLERSGWFINHVDKTESYDFLIDSFIKSIEEKEHEENQKPVKKDIRPKKIKNNMA